ncbi:MAG: HEAT repeat domain-containing protein, partial [Candidatus Thorarchaeota archaeon]
DEDIELRKEAIFALTNNPSNETVGALCILMGNANVEIRRSSAWALGKIGSEDSICCLLAALEDSDGQVIDWCIRGLRDMDSTRALQGLADVITRSSPEEQERLIRLVVEKKSEITLRAIAELMESDDVSVRRLATWAMAVSPYPPAVGMLEKLVNDEDVQVRDYAKKALVRLGRIDPTDLGLML